MMQLLYICENRSIFQEAYKVARKYIVSEMYWRLIKCWRLEGNELIWNRTWQVFVWAFSLCASGIDVRWSKACSVVWSPSIGGGTNLVKICCKFLGIIMIIVIILYIYIINSIILIVSIFWIALCFGMFICQWFKHWYWLEKWTSPRLTQVWNPFWSQEHLREVCGNSRRHLGVIWFCRDESGKFLMTQ